MEEKYSPMIRQYLEIKKNYADYLLFFRLGDFYELFNDDALIISKELNLVLTKKMAGNKNYIPMAGLPHHSYENYAERLLEKKYKIAICEQLEDASATKGIVKRGVVKVLTPGTKKSKIDSENVFIGSVIEITNGYDIAFLDVATGEIFIANVSNLNDALTIIEKYQITELLVEKKIKNIGIYQTIFLDVEKVHEENNTALNNILNYLAKVQNRTINNFQAVQTIIDNQTVEIDINTVKTLELIDNLNQTNNAHTIFSVLNKTKTSAGARLFKQQLVNPTYNLEKLLKRQKHTEEILNNFEKTYSLIATLENTRDLARLINLINNSPSFYLIKSLAQTLEIYQAILSHFNWFKENHCEQITKIITEIKRVVNLEYGEDNPNYLINSKIDDELDNYLTLQKNSKVILNEFLEKIKQESQINNLKIGQNKVFGMYLEVTKAAKNDLPSNFERKQTLSNVERYTSIELTQIETKINEADFKIEQITNRIIENLAKYILNDTTVLYKIAKQISYLDLIGSFAKASLDYDLVKPNFTSQTSVYGIRHLIVEQTLGKENFTTNNFETTNGKIKLITGPNMAGKSTYMKQIAICQIMAQIGMFVPAANAKIKLVDKIFTRMGSTDDITSNKSTFMIEMEETAIALTKATNNSLLIFDELGRGTATFDGMAIAKAVLVYLNNEIIPTCLFSTHYHELALLAKTHNNIENLYVEVLEDNSGIKFTHAVKKGNIDKSYGINVATIANIPHQVIGLAEKFIIELSENKPIIETTAALTKQEKLIAKIKTIDVNNITPIESLKILIDLQNDSQNIK